MKAFLKSEWKLLLLVGFCLLVIFGCSSAPTQKQTVVAAATMRTLDAHFDEAYAIVSQRAPADVKIHIENLKQIRDSLHGMLDHGDSADLLARAQQLAYVDLVYKSARESYASIRASLDVSGLTYNEAVLLRNFDRTAHVLDAQIADILAEPESAEMQRKIQEVLATLLSAAELAAVVSW